MTLPIPFLIVGGIVAVAWGVLIGAMIWYDPRSARIRKRRPVAVPTPLSPDEVGTRNILARRLCNWVLDHIATPWYRDWIDGAIAYGLSSVARDVDEDRDPPTSWKERL